MQPNVQHARGPRLMRRIFLRTVDSELTETNNEPPLRVFKLFTSKKFLRRTFHFSGGAYALPPSYATGDRTEFRTGTGTRLCYRCGT